MSLSSRVDISGRRRSAARRMRRGALPSSLIGLVTFSFTVLAFSSVAYTTSLPALVQAAQRADDDSLFYKALAGLTQAQGEGSASNDAAQGDGNQALGDAGQAATSDASGVKPPLGGVSLGGSMLQGVISNIAGVTQPKPDEPGSDGGSEQGGANPDGPAGGGSGGNGSGGGSDTGSGGSGGSGGGFSGGSIIGAGLILYSVAFGHKKMQTFFTIKTLTVTTAACLLTYCGCKSYSFFTGANHVGWEVPKGTPGALLSSGFILPLNICVGLVVACTMYGFYALFTKGEV